MRVIALILQKIIFEVLIIYIEKLLREVATGLKSPSYEYQNLTDHYLGGKFNFNYKREQSKYKLKK